MGIIRRHILIPVHGCLHLNWIPSGRAHAVGSGVQQCQQGQNPAGRSFLPSLDTEGGSSAAHDTVSCTGDTQKMQVEVGAAEVGS
jgi:hypothetical protein